jgi:SnoaL-like protein
MVHPARVAVLLLALGSAAILPAAASPPAEQAKKAPDAEIQALLDDYIRLYAADTLDTWSGLLAPGFVAAFTNDDGTTTTRNLEEFVARQRNYFATGRPIRETLGNVRIDRQGRLAAVRADFTLHDGDDARKGRLMMLLIRGVDGFRVQSLIFSYHLEAA